MSSPEKFGQTSEALQKRVERLTRVLDVASKVSAETDLDRLLEIIVREASAVLEADRCTLWILDEKNESEVYFWKQIRKKWHPGTKR